ncbi:uncharacterized protein [Panulirus ornatus]
MRQHFLKKDYQHVHQKQGYFKKQNCHSTLLGWHESVYDADEEWTPKSESRKTSKRSYRLATPKFVTPRTVQKISAIQSQKNLKLPAPLCKFAYTALTLHKRPSKDENQLQVKTGCLKQSGTVVMPVVDMDKFTSLSASQANVVNFWQTARLEKLKDSSVKIVPVGWCKEEKDSDFQSLVKMGDLELWLGNKNCLDEPTHEMKMVCGNFLLNGKGHDYIDNTATVTAIRSLPTALMNCRDIELINVCQTSKSTSLSHLTSSSSSSTIRDQSGFSQEKLQSSMELVKVCNSILNQPVKNQNVSISVSSESLSVKGLHVSSSGEIKPQKENKKENSVNDTSLMMASSESLGKKREKEIELLYGTNVENSLLPLEANVPFVQCKFPASSFKNNEVTIHDIISGKNDHHSAGALVRRNPRRTNTNVRYTEEKILGEDEYLYCEDCHYDWEGECPFHPLTLILDNPVIRDGSVKNRACLTAPWPLRICPSKIKGAGLGVWSNADLPPRLVFGPYEGRILSCVEGHESGYGWQLHGMNNSSFCVDAVDCSISNWMRYVNCPRNEREANLAAFQYRGQIYYKTLEEIKSGTELVVWYGDDYGLELSLLQETCEGESPRKAVEGCRSETRA